MVKNNEFVGVDDKYIPEDEQKKTHVQEPIIGSENAQKIQDSITNGVNKLTSDEGKEKVKVGAKKGLKVVKGVGIGYLIFVSIMALLVVIIIIVVIVNIIRAQNIQDQMREDFNNTSNSMIEEYNESVNNMEEDYYNAVDNMKKQYQDL